MFENTRLSQNECGDNKNVLTLNCPKIRFVIAGTGLMGGAVY